MNRKRKKDIIGDNGETYRQCAICGVVKPISEYYVCKDAFYGLYVRPECKKCSCERERRYRAQRIEQGRQPRGFDRIRRGKDGRMHHYVSDGRKYSWKLYWSDSMLDYLKAAYPRTKNEDICIHLGISKSTLCLKKRQLGLKKDPVWLSRLQAGLARRMSAEYKIMNYKPKNKPSLADNK